MYETMILLGIKPLGEYFCKACNQLRLSFIEMEKCGNCGSTDIVKGVVGTLDKEALKGEKP